MLIKVNVCYVSGESGGCGLKSSSLGVLKSLHQILCVERAIVNEWGKVRIINCDKSGLCFVGFHTLLTSSQVLQLLKYSIHELYKYFMVGTGKYA